MHSQSTSFVLWGSAPHYAGGTPIKLSGGTLAECQRDQAQRLRDWSGWKLGVYAEGAPPAGLRAEVQS